MAVIEAILAYHPQGIGDQAGHVIIGKTEDPIILRLLRDQILLHATEEAEMWQSIDPGIATMCNADVNKLISILSFLVPDKELQPELKSIKGGKKKEKVDHEKKE